MKKILIIVGLVFVLLIGIGIGSGSEDESKSEPKVEQTTEAPKTQKTTEAPMPEPELSEDEMDAVFVALVREKIDAFDSVTDDQIVTTGKQICADLRLANTQEELSAYMLGFYSEVSDYMTEYEVGYFIGASVGAYCPEKSYLIDELRQEAA